MGSPCSEARSRLSRSSRGLRSKEMSAQEAPERKKSARRLEGRGSNNKRLIHSHSLAPSRRTSANWPGRGRTRIQRGSDDSTEDDEPASKKPERDEAR